MNSDSVDADNQTRIAFPRHVQRNKMLTLRRDRRDPAPSSSELEDIVRLAYRSVLRREPDPEGLEVYASYLRAGRDMAWLVQALSVSTEFLAKASPDADLAKRVDVPQLEAAHILGHRPPMRIDADCTEAELQLLWDHVSETWSELGKSQPHWSVLTQDDFKNDSVSDDQLVTFYASGASEIERLNAWLQRNNLTVTPDAVCAEFGCGVGRITNSLAQQYARVIALDVSRPHLETAQARLQSAGRENIEYVQLNGAQSLRALPKIDVFYSIIALQHSPPPIILDVLEQVFRALRPGGYAYFQLPTYGDDYSYSVTRHLGNLAHGLNSQGGGSNEMEVHFVPQATVLEIAFRNGLRTVEIQPDTAVGNLDRWISNTFLLARA